MKFFFNFFRFSPKARGPPKIVDIKFFRFFEKQTSKLAFWNLAIIKRNKVRNFGFGSPDLVTAQKDSAIIGLKDDYFLCYF